MRDGSIHIAMAAQAVDKIKLGSAVFNIYGRSPGLMAQTAAELDVLSNGRFHLGLGSSGQAVIENWHGVPFRQSAQALPGDGRRPAPGVSRRPRGAQW